MKTDITKIMKFHLLSELLLCVCLGQVVSFFLNFVPFDASSLSCSFVQICAGSDELISGVEKSIRDAIYSVGDQFVDDFMRIVERNRNNSFITENLGKTVSKTSVLRN